MSSPMVIVFEAFGFLLQLFSLYLIHYFFVVFAIALRLFCKLVVKKQTIGFRLVYFSFYLLYLAIYLS